MKTLSIIIAGFLTVSTAFAQPDKELNPGSRVTIVLNGNSNEHVYINGKTFSRKNGNNGYQSFQTTTLPSGKTTVQVFNNGRRGGLLLM